MTDPYKVLGVEPTATDEEIKNAYRTLVKKYHPDNYSDDNPLKDLANEKMQEINHAYDEIQRIRTQRERYNGRQTYYENNTGGSYDPFYASIRTDINNRRYADAEKKLNEVYEQNRVAEWHYLMSLVLMSRKSVSDAMRELEIACSMDPYNMEYQRAKEMFNNNAGGFGNTYYGSAGGGGRRYRSSSMDACDCCTNLLCLDCLCECMGGDLIPCC